MTKSGKRRGFGAKNRRESPFFSLVLSYFQSFFRLLLFILLLLLFLMPQIDLSVWVTWQTPNNAWFERWRNTKEELKLLKLMLLLVNTWWKTFSNGRNQTNGNDKTRAYRRPRAFLRAWTRLGRPRFASCPSEVGPNNRLYFEYCWRCCWRDRHSWWRRIGVCRWEIYGQASSTSANGVVESNVRLLPSHLVRTSRSLLLLLLLLLLSS